MVVSMPRIFSVRVAFGFFGGGVRGEDDFSRVFTLHGAVRLIVKRSFPLRHMENLHPFSFARAICRTFVFLDGRVRRPAMVC
jgi:hypothetical protein